MQPRLNPQSGRRRHSTPPVPSLLCMLCAAWLASGVFCLAQTPPSIPGRQAHLPADQVVGVGVTVTLEVRAVGDEPLSYQWRFEEEPIAGATSATLTLADVRLEDAGRYDVVVTNAYGEVTSRVAVLTVDPTTFTKITTGPIAEDRISVWGLAWGDFDNDGYTRLFYRNQGDNTFDRILTGPIPSDDGNSAGPAWGDYDNDGDIDLCLATFDQTLHLFNNDGAGNFTRSTLGPNANYQVPNWVDYNNDGWLDLFVTHGPGGTADKGNRLFRNNGDGSFTEVHVGSVTTDGGYSLFGSWADFDNDGFPDLVVANGYQTDGGMFIYRNNGNANHWLNVRLIGTVSNRSAIGAKVRLLATIGDKTFWQLREIPGGCSRTHPDPRALFGLGDATHVTTLRIEWPSGIVQELSNLPANQFLTVTEPPRLRPLASNGFQIHCWLNQSFDVEASTDLATWTYLTTLTNETGTLEFHDQNNHDHPCRYYRVVSR